MSKVTLMKMFYLAIVAIAIAAFTGYWLKGSKLKMEFVKNLFFSRGMYGVALARCLTYYLPSYKDLLYA